MTTETKKRCFVISPIGSEESDTRLRSDKILRRIVIPAAEDDCGYKVIRADRIDDPGMITNQIVEAVITADIVIADLTELNPNVMYELAIRHGFKKPAILIAEIGTRLPFDIQQHRAIFVDHRDLDSAHACREAISKQILAIETHPESVDNPITAAFDRMALQASESPLDRTVADIRDVVNELRTDMHMIMREQLRQPYPPSRRNSPTKASSSLPYSSRSYQLPHNGGEPLDPATILNAISTALDTPNLSIADIEEIEQDLVRLSPSNPAMPSSAAYRELHNRTLTKYEAVIGRLAGTIRALGTNVSRTIPDPN